ncbi:MAG: hypothetical protein Q9217_003352 [Psora testacea]
MLSRFRMTVPDCKMEYEKLGQEVFGNPRKIYTLRFGVGNRYKYNAKTLEKVLQDISRRRIDLAAGDFDKITFPSGKGLCTTCVTARKLAPDSISDEHYLIRSYDHERRATPDNSLFPSPKQSRNNTGLSESGYREKRTKEGKLDVNYERAQAFEIWQVARAATAAKFFFEPLKIRFETSPTNEYVKFTDGGFGQSNNPVKDAKTEIYKLHGKDSIGIIVSVGTARKPPAEQNKNFFKTFPNFTREITDVATNPEAPHQSIQEDNENHKWFLYYRLNAPGTCPAKLDEWEPKRVRSPRATPGYKTMETIQNAFNAWVGQIESQGLLRGCAENLVASRRRRMGTTKWERYATGATYKCRELDCDYESSDGIEFREHLRKSHPILESKIQEKALCYRKSWKYRRREESSPR